MLLRSAVRKLEINFYSYQKILKQLKVKVRFGAVHRAAKIKTWSKRKHLVKELPAVKFSQNQLLSLTS